MAYAEAFAALADPTRRHIFEALRRQPKTVGELAEGQAVSRPAVSQHLKVLQSASLVSVEPQGNRRLYSIKREGLGSLVCIDLRQDGRPGWAFQQWSRNIEKWNQAPSDEYGIHHGLHGHRGGESR